MVKIVVYGCGSFFRKYQNKIHELYDVVAFVDKQENQFEKSYKSIDEVIEDYDSILIMIEKVDYLFDVIKKLLDQGIDYERIILGISCWGHYSLYDSLTVEKNGGMLLSKDGIALRVTTPDEFLAVEETIVNGCYYYSIPGNVPEVVIDIGMNIGDSTLFFANMKKVIKIYGFEPFSKTFKIAKDNLEREIVEGKVEVRNVGLSDKNTEECLTIYNGMSTGLSTISENIEKSRKDRINCGLLELSDEATNNEFVCVQMAHKVVESIIESTDMKVNYILKCDCEGEEYAIFRDLFRYNLLSVFSYIVLEWHNHGSAELEKYLNDAGFVFCKTVTDATRDRGIINAFRIEYKEDNSNGL